MKEKELEYQLHGLARLVASRVTQSKKPTKEKDLVYKLQGLSKESRLERNANFHVGVKLEMGKPFIHKHQINTNI